MEANADILVGSKEMSEKNFLFYGDNLEVLRKHIKDETVDLCYIDPPFNSQRNYNQIYNNIGTEDLAQAQAFTDTWVWDSIAIAGYDEIIANELGRFTPQTVELIKGLRAVLGEGSLLAYLISLTLRVTEIQRILTPTGSFYLHCDPTASHYLKLILDSIFVPRGGDYKSEIVWKRTSAHSSAKRYGPIHDVIFFYTKSNKFTWNHQYTPYDQEYIDTFFDQKDPDGRRWKRMDLTGAGTRNGETGLVWRDIDVTAKGRHWAYPPSYLEELDAKGRIHWPQKEDGMPRLKQYPEDLDGVPLQDIWMDIKPLHNLAAERLGYPTQKPLTLLERIIKASSKEGQTILDAYCGCGTTIDAAQKLKRRWIGIDITYQSIAVVLKRLEDVYTKKLVDSISLNGIPKDMKSAIALAKKKDDRLRKEFEKWAVLTYTNNRAVINDKKGADGGIDGTAYFKVGKKDNAKIIFQVKSGNVARKDIATLRGDMAKVGAELAVLITLEEPTKPMGLDAKAAGVYKHPEMGKSYDRISIVTIKEIIEEGKRLEIPMSLEVLKAAQKEVQGEQLSLI